MKSMSLLFELAGIVLVTVGIGMVHIPSAVIALGILLLFQPISQIILCLRYESVCHRLLEKDKDGQSGS